MPAYRKSATSSGRVSYATWMKMTPAQRNAKRRALGMKPKYSRPTLRGRGAYTYSKPGPWGKYGRMAGAALGKKFLTPYVGSSMASNLGEAAGGLAHYIGRIFGSGDYRMGMKPKRNNILQPSVPSFTSDSEGTITVKYREFLGDLISSATANTFSIQSFSLNPGLPGTFPWLSQVCGGTYQQYRINGMVFEYVSMSGNALNSVNTALGSVVMCTDYDSADAAFTSKQQMENTEFGISCKPSCNMIHAIECEPRLTTATELYVRAHSNPPNTDIRLYDWGKTYIATTGCQGTNVNLGEIWISYNITLFKTIQQPPGYLIPFSYYSLVGCDATHPLGTAPVTWQAGDSLDAPNQIDVLFESSNRLSFPSSTPVGTKYKVQYNVIASESKAMTWGAGVITSGNGLYLNPSSFWQFPLDAATVTQQITLQFDCEYKGPPTPNSRPYINIPNFTWAVAAIDQPDLYITQVSNLIDGPFTLSS